MNLVKVISNHLLWHVPPRLKAITISFNQISSLTRLQKAFPIKWETAYWLKYSKVLLIITRFPESKFVHQSNQWVNFTLISYPSGVSDLLGNCKKKNYNVMFGIFNNGKCREKGWEIVTLELFYLSCFCSLPKIEKQIDWFCNVKIYPNYR